MQSINSKLEEALRRLIMSEYKASLYEQLWDLRAQQSNATSSEERASIQAEINSLQREIDSVN